LGESRGWEVVREKMGKGVAQGTGDDGFGGDDAGTDGA